MARYDTRRKDKRNALVREYHLQYPKDTLAEIGAVFGISRQRVHRILHPKAPATRQKSPQPVAPKGQGA